MAQVKVFVTTPMVTAAGTVMFAFDGRSDFSATPPIAAVTVFGATGDVYGIGHVQDFGGLVVHFASAAGGVGRLPDVPLIELTLPVDKARVIDVNTAYTFFSDLNGRGYCLGAVQSGGIRVGGTLSVENVIPGGGIVPAGSTLRIVGTGFTPFTPSTKVTIEGVSIASTKFVSPTLMQMTLAAATEMTGKRVRVENPDGQQVDYWSWLHDVAAPASSAGGQTLYVADVFPLNLTASATFGRSFSTEPSASLWLALQNPSPSAVDVTVSNSVAPGGSSLGTNTFTIPAWSTLAPIQAAGADHVTPNVISSSAPIRILAYKLLYQGVESLPYPVEYMDQQPPVIGSLVNAASMTQGAIAPGEIITIFGIGEGSPNPAGLMLDDRGKVASTLFGTRVLFDDVPAPLLYTSGSQVNAVVPYEVAGKGVTTVQPEYNGIPAAGWVIPVASAAPAIFTLDSSGQAQGAVLNQDNTINGPMNPAARSSVIQIFATGEGQTTPAGVTGSVTVSNPKTPLRPVMVTIGGFDAQVQFAGSAPNSVAGLLQVNALVPPGVSPGSAVPLTLTIGDVHSPDGVTVAVK
jgi:uncharacterized protein (TIGR03437 family)